MSVSGIGASFVLRNASLTAFINGLGPAVKIVIIQGFHCDSTALHSLYG